jgi:hypothetical protein
VLEAGKSPSFQAPVGSPPTRKELENGVTSELATIDSESEKRSSLCRRPVTSQPAASPASVDHPRDKQLQIPESISFPQTTVRYGNDRHQKGPRRTHGSRRTIERDLSCRRRSTVARNQDGNSSQLMGSPHANSGPLRAIYLQLFSNANWNVEYPARRLKTSQ